MRNSLFSYKTILSVLMMVSVCTTADAAKDYLFEGYGTEESPYQIPDAESLKYFAKQMQTYEHYSYGKWFRLTADIVLNDASIIDTDYNVICDTARLEKWAPIGSEAYGKAFTGVFDGDGHKISGMFVDGHGKYDGYHGLFGLVGDCTIKNLTIDNSYVCGIGQIGAIVGYANSENSNIINCVSRARVEGSGATIRAGGIVGNAYESKITGCENYGYVSICVTPTDWGEMWNCEAGGVVGYGGNVADCVNYGRVSVETWGAAGGITGGAGFGGVYSCTNYGTIENYGNSASGGIAGHNSSVIGDCTNYGALVTTGAKAKVGGICGNHWAKARIYGCVNMADIALDVDNSSVGGICGVSTASQFGGTTDVVNLSDCINYGKIETSGSATYTGGICGSALDSKVVGCYNHGVITSVSSGAAGIIHYLDNHVSVINSRNYGDVTAKELVGGISALSHSSIDGCFNSGHIRVIDEGSAGGILASGYAGSSSVYVIDCVNIGVVEGANVCGIAGNYANSINNCYNAGTLISHVSNATLGGITLGNSSVNMCYNIGDIYNYGDGCNVGGLSGNGVSSMVSSFNAGRIFNYGQDCVLGNLIGLPYQNNYKIRTNYYLSGMIFSHTSYQGSTISESVRVDRLDNLTDALNRESTKWYSGNYWEEGYYHPVLKNYYDNTERYNFEVINSGNETVILDLGRPLDNSIFSLSNESTNCDLGYLCYNTVASAPDSIERFYLVDAKDFALDRELNVKNLEFNRFFGNRRMTSLCLPFEVTASDCPDGMSMYLPNSLENTTLHFIATESVTAGQPFLITAQETILNAMIRKYDFRMSPVSVAEGLLSGTFVTKEAQPNYYIFNANQQAFVKDDAPNINAFGTYIISDNSGSNVIDISLSSSGIGNVKSDCDNTCRVVGRHICFGDDSYAQVFDMSGRIVWQGFGGKTDTLPSGLYLVRHGDTAIKLHIR